MTKKLVPLVQLCPQGPFVSQFVFGTWRLATPGISSDSLDVLERVRHCIKLGITTFDCVPHFSFLVFTSQGGYLRR